MKNTVVIFNAGIGALTLGFQNAGYEILKAYEPDRKVIEIYQENISQNVTACSLSSIDPATVPDSDVWAFDLTQSKAEEVFYSLTLVQRRRPPAILFVMKKQLWKGFIKEHIFQLQEYGYHITHKNIQSSEVTAFPLREEFAYIVSKRVNASDMIMPVQVHKSSILLDGWVEMNPQDSWYYRIDFAKEKIDASHAGDSVLCWEKGGYRESGQVRLNLIKMPLIRIHGVYHKITHNEIARLKGFPEDFPRSVSNKSRMYRSLVYAPNIKVTEQVVRNLCVEPYINSEGDVQMKNWENMARFKQLFEKYLTYKGVSFQSDEWVFMTRMYSDSKEIATLKRLQSYSRLVGKAVSDQKKDLPLQNICVVANLVSNETKRKYEEAKLGYVWDIRNVLWLFEDYPELKNELISILNYSVENIEPERPEPFIFEESSQMENTDPESVADSYIAQLKVLETGSAAFKKYEELCVSILKYILGEYLTLWEQQKTTEENLYRFDMCCKIKNGVTQDFFDTICKYFSTKYIVFEFKNYEKPITQREIYTTEKYLYEKALRKVAIIISRKGADKHAKMAARGSLRESGKLIICLSDEDLKAMLQIKKEGEKTTGGYLEDILDDMLMRLEK
ncbi:DNA cytosine methyltransferase [Blautia massiliensis (ex Durand et al. 2017)]|uniref:DNA cytosine methyltransferase n=3 Tax=Blautia massiliensis (ex Durand et al. 2017) TaxID=1737424 RepID=UPI0022E56F09|nr:DNA cytosine methyltransferase [Blautia massiliensis (ex Durand et al. 2017)]